MLPAIQFKNHQSMQSSVLTHLRITAMTDANSQDKHVNVFEHVYCHLQFLPQDKVVEFAKLSPVELLRETQKAIGDSRLADLHKELIEENKLSNTSNRVSFACLNMCLSACSTKPLSTHLSMQSYMCIVRYTAYARHDDYDSACSYKLIQQGVITLPIRLSQKVVLCELLGTLLKGF